MFEALWVKLISQGAVEIEQWVPCSLCKITELDHTYHHSVFTCMQQHHWGFFDVLFQFRHQKICQLSSLCEKKESEWAWKSS